MHAVQRVSLVTGILLTALLTSCGSGTSTPDGEASKLGGWSVRKAGVLTGFSAPESATPDLATGNVYVSNMVPKQTPSGPDYWVDDGEGYMGRLACDNVAKHKWSTSTDEATFNSPKGMCILKGQLYIADVHQVLAVDLATAKPSVRLKPKGAQKLNDVATDGENLFVSDSGTGKITRIGPKDTSELQGPEGANGLAFRNGKLFCVSWTKHDLYEIDLTGKEPAKPAGLAKHFKNCDGLEVLPDGSFLVADCTGNRIVRVSADLKTAETLVEVPSPADIGLDAKRERLYSPSFNRNTVTIFRVRKK